MNTTIAFFSDIHCGSPRGLMRPTQWQLQTVNVSPSPLQGIIYDQYVDASGIIGEKRKDRRLVVVFVGDATEGLHHQSKQTISQRVQEHEEIACDAIDDGLKRMKYGDSQHDRFYMVAGTEKHVDESEERIAKDFEPVPYMKATDKVTRWCWPFLKLEINGVLLWITHHGPGSGNGANEGNPLRNKLRNITVTNGLRGLRLPQYVVFGHKHSKQHQQFEYDGILLDGFILPSFQAKTDWFYSIDPFALNDIGMLVMDIDDNGRVAWDWLTIEISAYQDRVERL